MLVHRPHVSEIFFQFLSSHDEINLNQLKLKDIFQASIEILNHKNTVVKKPPASMVRKVVQNKDKCFSIDERIYKPI